MAEVRRMAYGFLVSASFGLLGACDATLTNPGVPPPGSESYEEGYLHGCQSGFNDAGRVGYETSFVKDETRYANEPDYREGWNAGHTACFGEQEREPYTRPAF